MSDVPLPLLKKVRDELVGRVIFEDDLIEYLRKFQDVCNNKIKVHEKQLEFEDNELQVSFIRGEISILNEVLELNSKVFGVLDSQDKSVTENNNSSDTEKEVKL